MFKFTFLATIRVSHVGYKGALCSARREIQNIFLKMKIFVFVVEVPKLAGPGGSAGGWKVLGIIQTVAEEPG